MRETVLQIIMGIGFLIGLAGIGRQIAYNLRIFGLTKKSADHGKIQIILFLLFAVLFGISILLEK